jgi:hypothetical protein
MSLLGNSVVNSDGIKELAGGKIVVVSLLVGSNVESYEAGGLVGQGIGSCSVGV